MPDVNYEFPRNEIKSGISSLRKVFNVRFGEPDAPSLHLLQRIFGNEHYQVFMSRSLEVINHFLMLRDIIAVLNDSSTAKEMATVTRLTGNPTCAGHDGCLRKFQCKYGVFRPASPS